MVRILAAAFLCVGQALAPFARAELPLITLSALTPPGGQVGKETEVTVGGTDLEEMDALRFSHPGITARLKSGKTFLVSIPADVPPGTYDVRVSGKFGVSNPRAFVVGVQPEMLKNAAQDKPEAAVNLPLDTVFNGAVVAGSADYFRFGAQKGQRLLIECLAPEIDSRLAPVLTVLDQGARELAPHYRGAPLDFTAPADGPYLIRLHDLTYGGGGEHFYRLTVSSGPHLDFVFPPAAPPGMKSQFTLYGRNLPGGAPANLATVHGEPLEKVAIEIEAPATSVCDRDGLGSPGAAPVDGFPWRLRGSRGVSNALFISFASDLVVPEIEPNNEPAHAQKLTPPCEVAGQFFPAADADCYTFAAKKGDALGIEVISQRLGLPTNPFLLIQRETADVHESYGGEDDPGGKRFSVGTNDPAWRMEAKEDGVYRIKVRDLFGGTRSDPRNVYRLRVRADAPDFRLAVLLEPPRKKSDDKNMGPWSPMLRGGGTLPLRVVLFRRDGFTGAVDLLAEGLPEGVSCAPATIPTGRAEATLLLSATEKAPHWIGPLRIVGRSRIGEAERLHEARGAVAIWNVGNYEEENLVTRLTRDIAFSVSGVETAPVSLDSAEDKVWEAPVGGKLEIPLHITRRSELKQELKVTAFGAPAIEGFKDFAIDGKAGTVTAAIDLAAVKVPAGSYTIFFSGPTKVRYAEKDVDVTVCSGPVRILVK